MRVIHSGEIGKYHQMRASHLTSQILYGLSPNPYYKQKEITNRVRRNVISFSVRRYVCKQTRYTRFARAIYCRFAPMRYDINPFTPHRAYRLPQANIAPEGNITNLARDLYRCVFSITENTHSGGDFFKGKIWNTPLQLGRDSI